MLVRVSFNRGCSCKWPVHSGLRTHPCTASSDDFGSGVARRGGCHPVYGDGSRVVRGADRDSVVFLMDLAVRAASGGNLTPAPAATQGGAALVAAAQRRRARRLSTTSPTATRARKMSRSQITSIATPVRPIGMAAIGPLAPGQASGGGGPCSAARRLRNPSPKGGSLDSTANSNRRSRSSRLLASCRGGASPTPARARWRSAWPAPHPHGPTRDPGLPRRWPCRPP